MVDKLTANIEEEWNFDVIDADIQNAYALPGGYIVVYTGLIEDTERPEQLGASCPRDFSRDAASWNSRYWGGWSRHHDRFG